MSELASFMTRGAYSTAIMRVNYPIHQGKPNPAHGKYFFVGSILAACYDQSRNNGRGGSKFYETEQDAINAAIEAGATRIQKTDCSFV